MKYGYDYIQGYDYYMDPYGIDTITSYPYNGYDRYGVATISRLLKMIGLFCKRAI